jgi:hypothetical protein
MPACGRPPCGCTLSVTVLLSLAVHVEILPAAPVAKHDNEQEQDKDQVGIHRRTSFPRDGPSPSDQQSEALPLSCPRPSRLLPRPLRGACPPCSSHPGWVSPISRAGTFAPALRSTRSRRPPGAQLGQDPGESNGQSRSDTNSSPWRFTCANTGILIRPGAMLSMVCKASRSTARSKVRRVGRYHFVALGLKVRL